MGSYSLYDDQTTKRVWILFIYIHEFTHESKTWVSFPWLYVRHIPSLKNWTIWCLPLFTFTVKSTNNWTEKWISVFPPLMRFHFGGKPMYTRATLIGLFDYKHDFQLKTTKLQIIYIWELNVFRYQVERTPDYVSTHICTKTCYLMFIFYWQWKDLMTKNVSYTRGDQPLISYKNEQNFLENTYSPDNVPGYLFTLLWIWRGYGIFSIKVDKMYNEAVCYLIPLFLYISYDDEEKNTSR